MYNKVQKSHTSIQVRFYRGSADESKKRPGLSGQGLGGRHFRNDLEVGFLRVKYVILCWAYFFLQMLQTWHMSIYSDHSRSRTDFGDINWWHRDDKKQRSNVIMWHCIEERLPQKHSGMRISRFFRKYIIFTKIAYFCKNCQNSGQKILEKWLEKLFLEIFLLIDSIVYRKWMTFVQDRPLSPYRPLSSRYDRLLFASKNVNNFIA